MRVSIVTMCFESKLRETPLSFRLAPPAFMQAKSAAFSAAGAEMEPRFTRQFRISDASSEALRLYAKPPAALFARPTSSERAALARIAFAETVHPSHMTQTPDEFSRLGIANTVKPAETAVLP